MSNRRIKSCHADRTDLAVEDMHTLVGELRRIGLGTYAALQTIAGKLRIGKRRVRHLYYQDEPVLVDDQQQSWIADGAIRLLTHLAIEHEIAANRCRVRANEIRERQRQLELPLSGAAECGTSNYACAA